MKTLTIDKVESLLNMQPTQTGKENYNSLKEAINKSSVSDSIDEFNDFFKNLIDNPNPTEAMDNVLNNEVTKEIGNVMEAIYKSYMPVNKADDKFAYELAKRREFITSSMSNPKEFLALFLSGFDVPDSEYGVRDSKVETISDTDAVISFKLTGKNLKRRIYADTVTILSNKTDVWEVSDDTVAIDYYVKVLNVFPISDDTIRYEIEMTVYLQTVATDDKFYKPLTQHVVQYMVDNELLCTENDKSEQFIELEQFAGRSLPTPYLYGDRFISTKDMNKLGIAPTPYTDVYTTDLYNVLNCRPKVREVVNLLYLLHSRYTKVNEILDRYVEGYDNY